MGGFPDHAGGVMLRPPGAPASHPAPTSSATGPHNDPEPGDAAVWRIDQNSPPSPSSSSISVLVTRLGCSGGVTGRVLQPGVVFGDDSITVTFTVEAAAPGAYTCPGNPAVPLVIDLGQPLGQRSLVDGNCLPERQAQNTAFCDTDGGVRWPR